MDIGTSLHTVLQIIVALGLLNVWIVRNAKSTDYRGGQAKNLREEFAAYGLPPFVFYVVGGLKILSALALLAGIWIPGVSQYAAIVVVGLMLGALAMHLKIKDPPKKSLPAFLMLLLSLGILFTGAS